MAGCSCVATAVEAGDHPCPAGGLESAYLYGSWGVSVVRIYRLMVIVSVAFTVLSNESCTCMGKLKVPAWVGVPSRRLLKSGGVVSRVRPGGSSLMLLTTNQL